MKWSVGFVTLVMAAMLLSIALPGTEVPAQSQQRVRVGMPIPLTGFVAESAQEMVEGFKLYLEQSGQRLGGMAVDLRIEDTEAQPQMALTKMRKLVEQDKVDLVVGYYLAFEGYAVRDYVHKNKVPLFLPVVAADDLTQRKRSPYIVRMIWTSSQPNHPFGDYAYKKLGYRRMVTVGADYAFGWENVGGFQRTFELAGGKIVQKIWAPVGTNDYGPYIAQIRRDADAVYVLLVGSDIPRFFKQYQEFGLKGKIPLIGGNAVTDEDVLRAMGTETEGVLTSHTYAATFSRPENQRFVNAFRTRYKKDPNYPAEAMYTAALWLDRALKIAGSPKDPLRLVGAVKRVDLRDAPRGPLKLDAYNNPIETVLIRKVVKGSKGMQNEVIDTIPNVSQFWTFDPVTYLKGPAYTRTFPPCQYCEK
ncbi:MAG: ABC transporter substrate-binding protein [Armatimonadota bacterium]|nr:ABC transporter substrate-binding protein [Armatimonadota bacterium]MDR7450898.1 ABC transporter substrate-binding protein [Armatimonadota bacterium]MDR7465820.1 ABC transporter substrate-binding protein [Armatimonadota bacterium]MDR7493728.1 ABC transporter substrate-binding protein [Armatimonadota bacterium]MDR7498334.1 ABC transporter substrate-binding protein [Armatimonadota bacterium]